MTKHNGARAEDNFSTPPSTTTIQQWAREILETEADAIRQLAARLDGQFSAACIQIIAAVDRSNQVVVTGMGKAGLVGQKVAATFASTGTPSQFLHPAEAIHGDLGRVNDGDVVLAFSNSGETDEVVRLLPSFRDLGAELIAVTATSESSLGRFANLAIPIGKIAEACPLGLAPSATTAAMIAVGDAVALVVRRARGFAAADFARFHPGGSLGRKLARVEEMMRPLEQCRVAAETMRLRDVLAEQNHRDRRTGATMLIDKNGHLTGVITDSDLVRRIATGEPLPLDQPVSSVMSAQPKSVPEGCRMSVALEILSTYKISELPVLNEAGRPVGLIDVTDVMELLPSEAEASEPAEPDMRPPRIYREPEEA